MGPLPRTRPASVLSPHFLEDRCVHRDVERSSVSVEDHPGSLFCGVADADALPIPLRCEVRAPGFDFMVREVSPFDDADGTLTPLFFRYSGQLLAIVSLYISHASLKKEKSISFVPIILQVKSVLDKNTLDTRFLLRVVCGRALCSAAGHLLYHASSSLSSALNRRCGQYYSTHIFHAMARLDVPTWDDPAVASQITGLFPRSPHNISWGVIMTFVDSVSAVVRMILQTVILYSVLRGQRDGLLFALLTLSSNLVSHLNYSTTYQLSRSRNTLTFFAFVSCG
jgi:hypothetical protein